MLAKPASAQNYPTRNINMLVGFAAGGAADVIARQVGQKLGERLGRTIVVENRGGAGWQSRRQEGEQRGPRWLHAAHHDVLARDQRDRQQEQGLLGRRSAPHRDRRVQPVCGRRASEQSCQGPQGVRRQRQGEELHVRQSRRRQRPAYRRGVFLPRGCQGEGRACAVQQRALRRSRCSAATSTRW